jgi:transcription antitermination factor NusG
MPLLRREADVYPNDLFTLPTELEWRVAHVRSRQEKRLARHLLQHGVPYFLPQWTKTVTAGERKRTSHLPLFAGYVFFRGGLQTRDVLIRSGVTVSIIEVEDQQLLHSELEQLRRLQLAGASLVPVEELVPGEVVRIAEGAFAGYTGMVERTSRGDRLIVQISLLRKTVAIEFEREVLKRARRL